MTDLTKIEKPLIFCTKEEQEGLRGILHTPDALQHLGVEGKWHKLLCWDKSLMPHLTYRQNPDWQPPKLNVPDWFWENTNFNYVAMHPNGTAHAYKYEPCKSKDEWSELKHFSGFRLDSFFVHHDFNPHNVPWDQSLTKRPEE